MSLFRAIAVSIVVVFLIAGRGMWNAVATPAEARALGSVSQTTAIPDGFFDDPLRGNDLLRDDEVAQPTVDLFGNEIDEAVGDYRVDIRGDIYERHSPDTEVPKLGPPIG